MSRRISPLLLLGALGASACAGGGAPAVGAAAAPAVPRVAPAELQRLLTAYAHDSMLGREAGTVGNVKATDFIAARLRQLGLQPAGENGGWFQTIPLVQRGVDPASYLEVGGTRLAYGRDFLTFGAIPNLRADAPLAGAGIGTVYGGRMNDSAVALPAEAFRGKLVVLDAPLGRGGQPTWQWWPGFSRDKWAGAAGLIVVGKQYLPDQVTALLAKPQVSMQAAPPPAAPAPALFLALVGPAQAEQLLGAPLGTLQPGAAGKPVSADVKGIGGPATHPARNVIAVLPGSDPVLRHQYVAIGAHSDHVGTTPAPLDHDSLWAFNRVMRPRGAESQPGTPTAEQLARIQAIRDSLGRIRPTHRDSVYNGADDDGSGTVSVLAMAEAFAKARVKPRRSLLFVFHTAEEKGLWGAEWFTDHPTVPLDSIVAQLNMDMVGRGAARDVENGSDGHVQLVGSRRLSTELGDLVELVNTEGRYGMAFDYAYDANGHPANIYCRSDHAMYARYGIPVTFFTTDVHQDYHMLTDESAYIDYPKMARLTDMVADLALRIANRDARLVVDKPKPDPKAQCRQ